MGLRLRIQLSICTRVATHSVAASQLPTLSAGTHPTRAGAGSYFEGTLTYLLTGEEATIRVGEWVETRDANCIVAPKKPIKFTLDGFTGEHAGGRFKGRFTYVNDVGSCSGLDVPTISSWQGVFTRNASGQ